ncbi:hypothetical protein FQR65_LT14323 [Abscondita terminalis]|nr:hypothetical protein FQR65_LT14323 [Abscondita terminalis]
MCGIVGYVGPNDTVDVLLNGLRRLEYRGYDSAGIAVFDGSGAVSLRKRSGKLSRLIELLKDSPVPAAGTGIGHTRWATHGGPTDPNAHPHLGDNGKLALIHNGIVENFAELREELEAAGIELLSETDSEVVAGLLGLAVARTGDLELAFREVVTRLKGTFTLVAMHLNEPGKIVSARHHSPLVLGLGDGENFVGSDVAAFVSSTRRAVAVDEDNIAIITADEVRITDFSGTPVEFEEFEVEWNADAADKGGWSSFMAKEISEQPEAVANTIRGRIVNGQVEVPELTALGDDRLKDIERIIIIACGTASYAGQVGAQPRVPLPRPGAQRPDDGDFGEPVRRDHGYPHGGEVRHWARGHECVCLQHAERHDPAESDAAVYTHAGPEVAVASTKAFIAQITALILSALHLGRVRGTLQTDAIAAAVAEFEALPEKVQEAVDTHEQIAQLAHWMADSRSVLFLGRHVGFPIALEGALKLKEIAYIHAEGFAAGELKHGPIALIEPGQPVSSWFRARAPRRAAAVVRPGTVDSEGPRRRSTPQPRQIGDGGVSDGSSVILGIGVDTVDIGRFERGLERTPALLTRLFTPGEQGLSGASLAARFAAKEALIKALGGSDGLGWHDLDVVRDPGRPPSFAATPRLEAALATKGAGSIHLSVTHDGGMATAFVVVEALSGEGSHNVGRIRELTGGAVIVVVKAGGYGHGAHDAAAAALQGGAAMVATADLEEALALREAGISGPILCWLHGPRTDFVAGVEHDIELGVNNLAQLEAIGSAASDAGRTATVQLKVDTGLSRNGIRRELWEDVFVRAAELQAAGRILVRGIFSHLANAGPEHDREQAAAFDDAVTQLRGHGIQPEMIHLAASAATLSSPHLHYNTVRVGVAAYGLSPFPDQTSAQLGLIPAMTLRSEIVALRDVPAGTGVSYGYNHVCETATTLALVPMGYADGMPRALNGSGAWVTILGEHRPIVGRIGMDQFIVDVGPLAGRLSLGEPVVLFGDPEQGNPPVETWAGLMRTINYEIVVGIGPRVVRLAVEAEPG